MFFKRVPALIKNLIRILTLVFSKMNGSLSFRRTPKQSIDNTIYRFKPYKYQIINSRFKKSIPHPRSGHRIASDSTNFYSFGGYNPLIQREEYHYEDESYIDSYPLFQELWKFNFASRCWTKFNNSKTLPKELASNAVILYRNLLMVYGGTGSPFGTRCSNQLYICDISNESNPMVEVKTSGQLPLPQYGQALLYHHDYLYTIGGTTGYTYSCDIHRLNLKTFCWEAVYVCNGTGEFEPAARYRHEIGFDSKKIYILAGGTADSVFDLENIPTFDLDKREWACLKTEPENYHGYPQPRKCHGCVQIETNNEMSVFITGGQDGNDVFNDLWRLNLKTMHWTFFESCALPRPMYFHATSVTPQGKLYVFGGIFLNDNEDQVKRSNTVYSTWLSIPKLSELCWEAVLHYSPQIFDYSKDNLINSGLPKHFVQRLENRLVSEEDFVPLRLE